MFPYLNPSPTNAHWYLPYYLLGADGYLPKLYTTEDMTLSPNYLVGDINEDGTVDILDIVLLITFIMGIEGSEDIIIEEYPQSDINQDGELNVFDVILLVNILLENE